MLTLATKLKNLAFVVIAVAVLAYIGVRYTTLGRYVGERGFYVVNAQLAQTGGLYPNANVTYRGVSVGRVGGISLTDDGIDARLDIDDSAPRIPSDLQAVVANLSAVGEEYIDLRPKTDSGPYLADNSTIHEPSTQTPAPVTDLLSSVNALATSVPLGDLRTVVAEFGEVFAGQGQNLQSLLDSSHTFISAADAAQPSTSRLISDGRTVLQTQSEESSALISFAHSANLIASQLNTSDSDLRRLITSAPQAATQISGLLRDTDPSLGVVLANLLTTSDIAVTRQAGLQELLVDLPQVASAGATAITSKGANLGMALTFFSPLPCTSGYGGTAYRNGLDTSAGPALNTAARCTSAASSGVDVRGSAHAPSGGGVPPAAAPGSLDAVGSSNAALPGALGLQPLPSNPASSMRSLLGLPGTSSSGAR